MPGTTVKNRLSAHGTAQSTRGASRPDLRQLRHRSLQLGNKRPDVIVRRLRNLATLDVSRLSRIESIIIGPFQF
jgi:hypothetical protein